MMRYRVLRAGAVTAEADHLRDITGIADVVDVMIAIAGGDEVGDAPIVLDGDKVMSLMDIRCALQVPRPSDYGVSLPAQLQLSLTEEELRHGMDHALKRALKRALLLDDKFPYIRVGLSTIDIGIYRYVWLPQSAALVAAALSADDHPEPSVLRAEFAGLGRPWPR